MNKGDYSQAMADYYEAVKINPDNFNARCNLTLLFEMTELNRAIANCNEVIRLNPSLASAYYDRAKVYAKNADTEKAIVDYSESIRCDPNFTLAYFARADLYESNNEFHKALLDYRYIIEIAPDNKEAHNKLDILLHTIHLNEAIADYNESVQINHLGEVVQLNPKLALAYSNRGDVYASQGIFDHAIADYACAIWFNPQIVSFYYNRSSIFTRTEHYNQIINDFKNNLEIEPHESDTHREFGIYLMALGEIEEGKKYFRQAIELNPSLADELAQYLDDEA